MREELGATPTATRLVAVHENFWRIGASQDALGHEVCFYFRVELPDTFVVNPDYVDTDGAEHTDSTFVWTPLSELSRLTVYPAFLADLVDVGPPDILHFVTRRWDARDVATKPELRSTGSTDIRLSLEGAVFVARTGAIIVRNGTVLLAHNDLEDWHYTVGGKIQAGETAEQALRRETREELGTVPAATSLAAIHENYWREDDLLVHELALFFRVDLPDSFDLDRGHVDPDALGGANEAFTWIPLSALGQLRIAPPSLGELAVEQTRSVQHAVVRETGTGEWPTGDSPR